MSAAPEPTPNPESTPAPEPTPAPAPAADWRASYAEDIRSHPKVQELESAEAGLRELIGAQKFLGVDKFPAPQETWNDTDWAEHYERLGRPADPSGYDFSNIEPPDGLPMDDGFALKAFEMLHHLGLDQRQFEGVVKGFLGMQGETWKEMQTVLGQAREADAKALREEWGQAYPAKLEAAERAAMNAWTGELAEELKSAVLADGTPLVEKPWFRKGLSVLGESMQEHGIAGSPRTSLTETPEEAEREIRKLEKSDAYFDPEHEEHKATVARIAQLYEIRGGA